MKGMYEAVVRTTDGVFRAYRYGDQRVMIIDDDLPGIADQIVLSDLDGSFTSPESLVQILISWIYETHRGLEILDATLTLGND